MLTPNEELRLASIFDVIEWDKKQATKCHDLKPRAKHIDLKTVEWLATKLREANNELSQVHAELFKINKEFANYVEAHE